MDTYDVIVIGGGLAGLSSAFYLTQKNKKVLLLEAKKVVGGRTASWIDGGMQVESRLHRMLGFYEVLPQLMEDAGVKLDDAFIWEDELSIRLPDGVSGTFAMSLHKPVKTVMTSLGNTDLVSQAEKAILAKFFTQGFIDRKKPKFALDKLTVREYAVSKHVPEKLIYRVLTPLTEGLFFLPPDKYSAYTFFSVFAPYITKFHKTRIGAFASGMTESMSCPIADAITKNSGEVQTDAPVDEIFIEDQAVTGVRVKNKKYKTSKIVLATGLRDAETILKKAAPKSDTVIAMRKLETKPSVTAQFELTEPALDEDRVTFSPGTVFACYSEQSRTTFRETKGRLSVILAHAEKYVKEHPEKIVADLLTDAKKIDINLTKETIKKFQVVKWKHDFYSYAPGYIEHIPPQETKINGLVLAGDYTKQEYLQTMEGAAYSGKSAAEIVT